MFEVSNAFSWRIREKRARERITATKASEQIGITRQTLRTVECGEGKIKKTVYQKIVNWLVAEQ